MENDKISVLNCYTKILTFWYKGEFHSVDLAEGDLHDSWNGVNLKDDTCFDFNFTWDEEDEDTFEPDANGNFWTNDACFSLYVTYWENGELLTDHSNYDSFTVDKFIGTNADYFNEDVTTDPNVGMRIEKAVEFKM